MKQKFVKFVQFVVNLGQRLYYYFIPLRIPTGLSTMEGFIQKTLGLYGLPDLPSYHRAMAAMIQVHADKSDKIKLVDLARCIRGAQSKQVAFEIIQRVKRQELDAIEAAKAKEPPVVSDDKASVTDVEAN